MSSSAKQPAHEVIFDRLRFNFERLLNINPDEDIVLARHQILAAIEEDVLILSKITIPKHYLEEVRSVLSQLIGLCEQEFASEAGRLILQVVEDLGA